MVSVDDMKSMIQEWMAQELTISDLSRTYTEVRIELDKQLEYCINSFIEAAKEARE